MSTSLPQKVKVVITKGDKQPHLEEIPLPNPGKNQVLVKMAFAPINQSDLQTLAGAYKLSDRPPYPVGLEGSGTIAAVGEDLQVAHKVGDRVHVHTFGTHAQYCLAKSEDCSPITGDMSFEDAASHIINPSTVAYMYALAQRGGSKAVISTAASSALGKMLIRYFKEKGIKTINTVRQDKYIDDLKKEGADYVLNSEAPDFEEKLKEVAEKEHATVAFDAINGDFPTKLLKNMPAGSIVHVYGTLSGDAKWTNPEPQTFDDNKKIDKIRYLTYIQEVKEKGELDKLYEELHSHLNTTFRTNTQKVYPLEEVKEAVEYYKKNSSKGKILIKLN